MPKNEILPSFSKVSLHVLGSNLGIRIVNITSLKNSIRRQNITLELNSMATRSK